MRTCQTAANEFLRQFWSSVYPPASDAQNPVSSTPTQKIAKAAKMAGYLANTPEKVEAIVRAAVSLDCDPHKIEVVSGHVEAVGNA